MDVRRAGDRFATQNPWLDSRHSFSFGRHYDAANTGFGLLFVNNDDVVAPGSGFSTHPHRDMEILTWVLDGELVHQDSEGHTGLITPGLAQRMSAGTGILHSERNGASASPVHFVQMWVRPDTERVDPSYAQLDISAELDRGGLVPVALPDAPMVHLFVAKGGVDLDAAGRLETGDAVRLTAAGGPSVTAVDAAAEVLVWEMARENR